MICMSLQCEFDAFNPHKLNDLMAMPMDRFLYCEDVRILLSIQNLN